MNEEQKQSLFNFIADLTGHNLMDDEMNSIEYIVKGEEQYLKEANLNTSQHI